MRREFSRAAGNSAAPYSASALRRAARLSTGAPATKAGRWGWALLIAAGLLLWVHGCHAGGHEDDLCITPGPAPKERR
jgi:hypothetical protein